MADKFIFRKEVDKSVLLDGLSIPTDCVDKLFDALENTLSKGVELPIKIIVNGDKFEATLKNQKFDEEKYANHSDVVQIRYSRKSEIAKKMKEVFCESYKTIDSLLGDDWVSKKKLNIPDAKKEFIDIYVSSSNELTFDCITLGSQKPITYWIRPANGQKYNHFKSYEKNQYIDWTQNNNYNIGDIVYIYYAEPYQRIMFKCVVSKINIDAKDKLNDEEFWIDKEYYEEKLKTKKFVRLQLVANIDNENLTIDYLHSIGLEYRIAGARTLNKAQVEAIEKYVNEYNPIEVFKDEEVDNTKVVEGNVLTVKVNKYERSTEARKKCIAYHGCKCMICGLDFEKTYGEIGKGFIHVHHLTPLYKIKKGYVVDFKKDLIPVCPNCHAMIHKLDGLDKLSVDEIRKRLLGK